MSKSVSGTRFWAMMCHFSTLLGFVLPGFSLIAPLIIWGVKRDQDALVHENGRNVINFVLSCWLYSLVLVFVALFMIPFLIIPFLNFLATIGFFFWGACAALYGIIYFFLQLIFPIYGGIKAFNGEVYRYPWTIPFLKQTPPKQKVRKSSAK